ncbi:MAG: alpha/beta fold hydrolase [Solirubrobacteraceae bacterium]
MREHSELRETLAISEHTAELDDMPVFWRQAPYEGDIPPLYLHGVPACSDDWGLPPSPPRPPTRPRGRMGRLGGRMHPGREARRRQAEAEARRGAPGFLGRCGGIAVDLPGFGRSGKRGDRRYDIAEYDGFIERFLDLVEIDRVKLVTHDWGAVGLAFAQRLPERIERLVVINTIPLLPGYRWHRVARIWRTPIAGELAMGSTSRSVLRLVSREATATPGPMPEIWLDSVMNHLDQGTQRAILRLYRSAPSQTLAAAGAALGTLTMPSLVVWGTRDPYIPARFAHAYAAVLPDSELALYDDAGHWPWLDRPDVIDRVCAFLLDG